METAATETAVNQLGALLARPMTITVTIPWADEPLEMELDVMRPAKWGDVHLMRQASVLSDLNEEERATATLGVVYALICDARGVPGFDARREGEHMTEFRARFRQYFEDANAEVLLFTLVPLIDGEETVPLSERKATFRG